MEEQVLILKELRGSILMIPETSVKEVQRKTVHICNVLEKSMVDIMQIHESIQADLDAALDDYQDCLDQLDE